MKGCRCSPELNTSQICSLCELNILLLHALCIKNNSNIPISRRKNSEIFCGRGLISFPDRLIAKPENDTSVMSVPCSKTAGCVYELTYALCSRSLIFIQFCLVLLLPISSNWNLSTFFSFIRTPFLVFLVALVLCDFAVSIASLMGPYLSQMMSSLFSARVQTIFIFCQCYYYSNMIALLLTMKICCIMTYFIPMLSRILACRLAFVFACGLSCCIILTQLRQFAV